MQTVKCEFSTSEMPAASELKPGGTPMGLTGKWCRRAPWKETGEDLSGMGRWSYMNIKGKNGVSISAVTASI